MPTALQLGQRQLPIQKILQHLTTSPFLSQYLRLVIVEETLTQWQQSPEYATVYSEAELTELYHQIAGLANLSQDPGQIETAKRAIALQKYQQVTWGHKISSHFLARKGQLDRAIFSAIQVESLGMAQEIYLRVKDRRQSFDKLARLYSQGAEAKLGGVMGPISVHQVHPQIAYHLIGLEPGELSPLFQLNGLHIFIRLEQRLPARFDDEMKGQLMEELFEQWVQSQVTSRIADLQIATFVTDEQLAEDRSATTAAASVLTPIAADGIQRKELVPAEIEVIEDDPSRHPSQQAANLPNGDRPLATLPPGASFFPPVSEGHSPTEVVEHDNLATSFFAPQSTPTQIIDRQQKNRQQAIFQQIVAFFIFFGLFLGGGFGTIYLLNILSGTPGIHTGHKE
jgi:PPIC-type PPIASE domain